MRLMYSIVVAVACVLGLSAVPAYAAFSQTVNDSDAQFSSFSGQLLTALDATAVGGSYHYINNWGADGGSQSGVVKYQLSGVPAGNNLYHLEFSSPTNATFGAPGSIAQWHIFNVAADGTENNAQAIPWVGMFGTNKQWLGPNSGYNPGGWTLLGPGPQSDGSLEGGIDIWLNGSGSGSPYIYLGVQGFYNSPIAFDAIRVTQIPEPGSLVLSVVGASAIGLAAAAWRRRKQRV